MKRNLDESVGVADTIDGRAKSPRHLPINFAQRGINYNNKQICNVFFKFVKNSYQ
ncbi:MAG: hypothetical protein WC401_12650 [Bacteroidales bacterium]